MKLKFLVFFITFLSFNLVVVEAKSAETIREDLRNAKNRIMKTLTGNESYTEKENIEYTKTEAFKGECPKTKGPTNLRQDLACAKKRIRETLSGNKSYQKEKRTNKARSFDEKNNNISVYTGTFDTIDKEGDDQTTLMGVEHKNKDLFRDTWIGRFSPTTGAFVTKKNSIYLYTGIEADYNLGPINISPSFAPGYYEAGDGKNLGSALEFKSEIKVGVDLFKNTNLGYSYSHISNNDWGDVNPGTDNQSVTISKKF
jgi:lipid A 3-O-deacylase|tara:strand:+ start:41 stop:808 length:768 start_codon:yes stop_codon:yes gene_type:complete